MALQPWWALAASLTLLSQGAMAAELTASPSGSFDSKRFPLRDAEGMRPPAQMVHLDGDIVPGDAARLKALLADLNMGHSPFTVLSLDSPGGDFREGIRIAQVLRDGNVATLVERDATCLSACAVAFMAGYQYHEEVGPFFSRYVEIGATLGFHRPFLTDVSDFDPSMFEGLSQDEINEVMSYEYATFYDLANQLIQEMLAVDPTAWKNTLLVEMLLATAGDDGVPTFVYLTKVGQAIEWDIRILGAALPRTATREDHLRDTWWMCYNQFWPTSFNARWQDAFEGWRDRNIVGYSGERATEWDFVQDVTVYELSGDGCEVSLSRDGQFLMSGLTILDLSVNEDWHHLYDPRTPLTAIAAQPDATPVDLQARLAARLGVCRVFDSTGALTDEQRCEREFTSDEFRDERRWIFTWPSGTGTAVEDGPDTGLLLNGASATEALHPDAIQGNCWASSSSGNTFCYGLK